MTGRTKAGETATAPFVQLLKNTSRARVLLGKARDIGNA